MGRLAEIQNTVGLYKCDRCGFTFDVTELVEEEETGLIVDQKCLDKPSHNEMKRDGTKESYQHHFNT